MKKLIPFLISGFLVVGAVGCESGVEKTSADAPNTANETAPSPGEGMASPGEGMASPGEGMASPGEGMASPGEGMASPTADSAQQSENDATSEVRRRQLNSDIRAREERNNATGGDEIRADADHESEGRSTLEANLPASQLAVEAEQGAVTVSGTVPTDEQLSKIDTLAKEIKGVQSVSNKATVTPAQPQ